MDLAASFEGELEQLHRLGAGRHYAYGSKLAARSPRGQL
jgi:hypothetical protein